MTRATPPPLLPHGTPVRITLEEGTPIPARYGRVAGFGQHVNDTGVPRTVYLVQLNHPSEITGGGFVGTLVADPSVVEVDDVGDGDDDDVIVVGDLTGPAHLASLGHTDVRWVTGGDRPTFESSTDPESCVGRATLRRGWSAHHDAALGARWRYWLPADATRVDTVTRADAARIDAAKRGAS